ncbi:recombination protein RecR [Candidatus Collierbacteria bacterium]|nr:recombination protein RecR [Candidatus Collierbacteria bacterium]
MKIPRAILDLTNQFERLPGIGPKTAQRLTFYLLHVPQNVLDEFSRSVVGLKRGTVQCSICQNVAEVDPCPICSDSGRDNSVLMVVEHPLDVFVVERAGVFDGVYHVLHGLISPLDNIGPDELFIKELLGRLKDDKIREIVLGLNPTMEGEATALYLKNKINAQRATRNALKVTRLGQGMPTGGDIQYADESTLKQAMEGRRGY